MKKFYFNLSPKRTFIVLAALGLLSILLFNYTKKETSNSAEDTFSADVQEILNESYNESFIFRKGKNESLIGSNLDNRFNTVINKGEIKIIPITNEHGRWTADFEFKGLKLNNEFFSPNESMTRRVINQKMVESYGDNLDIVLTNSKEGLRQDFVINNGPQNNIEFEVKVRLESSLIPKSKNNRDLYLHHPDTDEKIISYKDLKVYDANGTSLDASLAFFDNPEDHTYDLVISGQGNNITYPLTIDPLIAASWEKEGNLKGANFGYSLSGGCDFNGDGYDDIAIGLPGYSNGQMNEGQIKVYNGSATGLSNTASFVRESNQTGGRFGFSLDCAGDVDSNGIVDLVVGAYAYEFSFDTMIDTVPGNIDRDEGAIFVYYGTMGSDLTANNSDTLLGWQDTMRLGISVAGAGDVNGDGISDIIVGALSFENGQAGEGAAYVYKGQLGAIDFSSPFWEKEGDIDFGNFGFDVNGAGDVNKDGFDDIMVGAYQQRDGAGDTTGKAYVYRGATASAGMTQLWSGVGPHEDAQYGIAVSGAGDFNNDGVDDIMVGADRYADPFVDTTIYDTVSLMPLEIDTINPINTGQGAVYIYYGTMGGTPSNSYDIILYNTNPGSGFGSTIDSLGDVNGDDISDIIVGAPLLSLGGELDEGAAFAYYGAGGLPDTLKDPDWFVQSDVNTARFGSAVAGAGDVNGDMINDAIIGAFTFTSPDSAEGAAFVFHGNDPCGLPAYDSFPVFLSFPEDSIFGFAGVDSCEKYINIQIPHYDDNCPNATITNNHTGTADATGVYDVGSTTVTYTLTNSYMKTVTRSFVVHIEDQQAPVPVNCDTTIMVDVGMGNVKTIVNYPTPDFMDNCAVTDVIKVSGPDSGDELVIGIYEVVYKGVDDAMNETFCTFRIFVLDQVSDSMSCNGFELMDTIKEIIPIIAANARYEETRPLFGAGFNPNIGASMLFKIIEGALGIDIPGWVENLLGVGGGGIDIGFFSLTFGMTPGFNMEYGTYNQINGADSATIEINYPAKVCITHPKKTFFGCKDTIEIGTNLEVLDGAKLVVEPGVLQQEIGVTFKDFRVGLDFYINASACVGIPDPFTGSCIGWEPEWNKTFELIKPIKLIDDIDLPLIVTCDDLFRDNPPSGVGGYSSLIACATGNGQDTGDFFLAFIEGFLWGAGFSMHTYDANNDLVILGVPPSVGGGVLPALGLPITFPEFDFTFGRLTKKDLGPLSVTGKQLKVSGCENVFSKFRFDLLNFVDWAIDAAQIAFKVEDKPCLAFGITMDIGCGLITLDIADVNASLRSKLLGEFTFDPTVVMESIDLGMDMAFKKEGGMWEFNDTISGVTAGESFMMVIPDNVTGTIDINNIYDISGEMKVFTEKQFFIDVGIKFLEFGGRLFGLAGKSFDPLYCNDPAWSYKTPGTEKAIQNHSFFNSFNADGLWELVPDTIPPCTTCDDTTVYLNEWGLAFLDPYAVFDRDSSFDKPVGGTGTVIVVDVYPDTIFCSDWPGVPGFLVTEDDNCNYDTCEFWVTVHDTLKPYVTCQDITVQIGANGLYYLRPDQVAIGAIDNCSFVDATITPNKLTCDNVNDSVLVRVDVVDIAGNTNFCEAYVHVLDTSIFVLECPYLLNYPAERVTDPDLCTYRPDNVEFVPKLIAPDCETTLSWVMTGSTMDSGNGTIGSNQVFNLNETLVTYTATDASGNQQSCSFIVKVEDNQKPKIPCPGDTIISTNHDMMDNYNCETYYEWNHPFATDNCMVDFYEVTYIDPDGTETKDTLTSRLRSGDLLENRIFYKGETQIIYYAQDTMGLDSTCGFTVTVIDDEDPMIFCDSVMVYNTFSISDSAKILPNDITNIVIHVEPSMTINDVNIDIIQGSFIDMGDLKASLRSPNGTVVTLFDGLCGGTEDFNMHLDDTSSINITAAPCDPLGQGGIYASQSALSAFNGENSQGDWILSFENTQLEGCGSLDSFELSIRGNDTLGPINRIQVVNDPGLCSFKMRDTFFDPPFKDNCPDPYIRHNAIMGPFDHTLQGAVFPLGETEVRWIVYDQSGNTDTCFIIIEVLDTEAPTFINCPRPDVVENAETDLCEAYVNFSIPLAEDNCDSVVVRQIDTTGLTSGDVFPVGTTILLWEAEDAAGNTSQCSVRVIVNDTQEPELACGSGRTVETDPWLCEAVVDGLQPLNFNDNCLQNISIVYQILFHSNSDSVIASGVSDASNNVFPSGTSKVEYRLADQPVLLLTEITQSIGILNGGMMPVPYTVLTTDDYVEITNFGPGAINISGLTLERFGGAPDEIFTSPDNTIMNVGDVLVVHFGNGTDDPANLFFNVPCALDLGSGTPTGYVLSYKDVVIDVTATNGYDPIGNATTVNVTSDHWNGTTLSSAGKAGQYRKWTYDNDEAYDWFIADVCHPITIGQLNPDLEVMPDNGVVRGLQSIYPNIKTCDFDIIVEDKENPSCGEFMEHRYDGGTNLNIQNSIVGGKVFTSVISVPDDYEVGEIVVENIQGIHGNLGDLIFKLTSPEGTQVIMVEGQCEGFSGFHFTMDDSLTSVLNASCPDLNNGSGFAPKEPLKRFYGENVNGDWKLEIADTVGLNDGLLSGWTLFVNEIAPYSQGDTTIPNDLGFCEALFGWRHPRHVDNCCAGNIELKFLPQGPGMLPIPGNPNVVGGDSTTQVFEVGVTIVRYILTDTSGNVDSCEFTVTVVDAENPAFTNCPVPKMVVQLSPGECETFWFFGYEADDNCGVDTIIADPPNGSYFDIGTHIICVVVTDTSGNTDTCKYKLEVLPFIPATNPMVCNDQIQLSLDSTCTAVLTADMMLEGNDYLCYDLYRMEITEGCDNSSGASHSNIFTLDDIGKCFTVTVIDMISGNSCWGCVCIEDKLVPEIACPPDTNVTCAQSIDPFVTGRPSILSCVKNPTMTYHDEVTDNGECQNYRLVIEREWTVRDASGNEAKCTQIIRIKEFNLNDVIFPADVDNLMASALSCDEGFDDVIDQKIDPTKEEINPGSPNPHFPAHEVDVTNGCYIGCVDDYLLDTALYNQDCRIRVPRHLGWNKIQSGVNAGHPSPFPVYYKSHWQWVQTGGRRCFGGFPTDDPNALSPYVKWQGTGVPTISNRSIFDRNKYCALSFTYEDQTLDICDDGYEILRKWTVKSRCLPVIPGQNPRIHTQVIRVIDDKGPEIIMPDVATAGMNSWNCYGTWIIPEPWLKDNCSSDLSYIVKTWSGNLTRRPDGRWVVSGLDEGVHKIVIEAEDACGNVTEKEIALTVIDDIPPTPVCETHTTVSLTNTNDPSLSFVKIYAEDFDDGSTDNCNDVWFKVIRMDELLGTVHGSSADNTVACNGLDGDDDGLLPGNQVYFDNSVKFCCADVDQSIMVVFRVFDVNPGGGAVNPARMQRTGDLVGRYSDCMVEVEVQNKSFPIVVAPDDVAVSCMFWFDDSEDALTDPNNPTFGRVATSLSARSKLKTTDLACEAWCEDHDYSYLRWFPNGRAPNFVPAPEVSELACNHARTYFNSSHPDYKYNFVWGWDGYVSHTCGVQPEIRINDRRECGQGLITRDVIVTVNGVRYMDRQEIWVVDCDPFEINPDLCRDNTDDIEWPLSCNQPRAFDGCGADLSPDNPQVGKPEIVGDADDNCALISIDYTDDTITIEQDACFKVIRDWRVVDWCHFDITKIALDANGDEYGYVHPHPGEWHYQQILKVRDQIDPVVNCSAGDCEPAIDTVITGTSGCHAHIDLQVDATDDCSPNSWLSYDYKIDLYNDQQGIYGTYDIYVGQAHPGEEAVNYYNPYADNEKDPTNASGIYPLGQHMLQYYVEDGCGNVGVCNLLFEILDCKAPTPYCETGIITVVMPSSGSITVWASDLDAGSFDNCTPRKDLKLYFNGDDNWTGYVVNCDTFENRGANEKVLIELELWVEDEEGNTDYCITTIEVQDNSGVCSDSTNTLAGSVKDQRNAFIEKSEVRLLDGSNIVEVKMTDGQFAFRAIPSNVTSIAVYKNNDFLNGVSTRDLVAIQKHLLGYEEFDSGYEYIAADGNNNGNVSTADISTLRKVILGRINDLSKWDQKSWRFIPRDHQFKDFKSPFPYPESLPVGALIAAQLEAEFLGIKIGDLTGDAQPKLKGVIKTRNNPDLILESMAKSIAFGETYRMEISSNNFTNITGMQYTLDFDPAELKFEGIESGLLTVGAGNYSDKFADRGQITMSWNDQGGISTQKTDVLFTLIFTANRKIERHAKLHSSSAITIAEAYDTHDQDYNIEFRYVNEKGEEISDFALHQNVPNPFDAETEISFNLPRGMPSMLTFYDVHGKILKKMHIKGKIGLNRVKLNADDLGGQGLIYYQLDAMDHSATKRMFIIKR